MGIEHVWLVVEYTIVRGESIVDDDEMGEIVVACYAHEDAAKTNADSRTQAVGDYDVTYHAVRMPLNWERNEQ